MFDIAIFDEVIFDTGDSSVVSAFVGGDDVPRKSPHRGWNLQEWKRRVKDGDDAIERTLRQAYADLTGEKSPLQVLVQVDAIVTPIAIQDTVLEAPIRVDWRKINLERANALMQLWHEEQELAEDFFLLVH